MKRVSPARMVRHRPVTGIVVAIVGGQGEGLDLTPMTEVVRVLQPEYVYELVYAGGLSGPGTTEPRYTSLGFFEVKQGAVAVVGDDVRVRGSVLGEVTGFDGSHLPDHLHVIVGGKVSGEALAWGFSLGDRVVIGPTS